MSGKVVAIHTFGRPDERRRDVANLEKATGDTMTRWCVLEDHSQIVDIQLRWDSADEVKPGECRVELVYGLSQLHTEILQTDNSVRPENFVVATARVGAVRVMQTKVVHCPAYCSREITGMILTYSLEALLVLAGVGGALWLGRYVVRNYADVIHPPSGDYRKLLDAVFLFSLSLISFALLAAIVMRIEGWDFGTFGDFFGGFVNPILTFITIIGLIVTIVTQQEAAKEGRIQAARQLFDSTFFQMLSTHNSIVNALEVENDHRTVLSKGRYCFKDYYLTLKAIYETTLAGGEIHKIGAGYKIVIGLYQPDLAHYFRFLYNMVRLIDTSPCNPDEKMNYMRLLRAQLSNYETAMLFYNSLMSYGMNFRPYIKRYALLDNLPPSLLFKPDHLALLNQPAFNLDAESSAKP